MIKINVKENNFSVIGTEVGEIFWTERVSTKIDNEIGLFAWWHLSHVLIMRHNPHLKDISRTKFMTENMTRNCFTDIIENTLNFFPTAAIFRRNTRFDILEIEGHKNKEIGKNEKRAKTSRTRNKI